jgi:NAD(P)-dependent dehydrogenase (short-subunit alcohol dehydrogenase family)
MAPPLECRGTLMAWTLDDIPDQTGRVVVVTGANGGLGLVTARALAGRGAVVIMAARNPERTERAVEEITAAVPGAELDVVPLDLASLESVRTCAGRIAANRESIDLLVNNAGLMAISHAETEDGFEMQLGVNHLGHFALTALLFPLLLRGSAPRVVTVSSGARHFSSGVSPDDPHLRQRYGPWRSYGQSKLANVQFALELQRRADAAGAGLASLAVDPGFSATDLQAHSRRASGGGLSQVFFHRAVAVFGSSPEVGAMPQLRAATDPETRGGELYGLRWIAHGAPVAVRIPRRHDRPADGAALWALSEGETGIEFDVAAMVRRR